MRRKQFTLEWFKEFGWLNNPFRLEIFNPIGKYLTGYDREKQKLNYFIIEDYSFGSIRAEKGAGKSMMLLWLKQSLQSYKGSILAVYYKSEKRAESLSESLVDNFTSMSDKIVMGSLFKLKLKKIATKIKEKLSRKKEVPHSIEEMQEQQHQQKSIYERLYQRKFSQFNDLQEFFEKKLKGQRLVLLIDDAHNLSESDVTFISDMLESSLPCQVVIALDKGEKNPFKAKDVLKMNLSQLSYKEIENMLKVRIASVGGDGISPFNDHMLHGMYNKGKKNPLHILKIAYDQAVKLSLKHLSDRKKGIVPKKERPEVFDEAAEYRKLLEEERRKAKDPNDLILEASFEKPKKEKKKPEEPKSSAKDEYKIQVIENTGSTPIEISMGSKSDKYEIREAKKSKPLPMAKRRSSAKKKTRRKTSTRHHSIHKKKSSRTKYSKTKSTRRKKSSRKRSRKKSSRR